MLLKSQHIACGSQALRLLRRITTALGAKEPVWFAALPTDRLNPADRPGPRRHRRVYLQPSDFAAPSTPDHERQPSGTLAGGDHFRERLSYPPITTRAVGVQLVAAGV